MQEIFIDLSAQYQLAMDQKLDVNPRDIQNIYFYFTDEFNFSGKVSLYEIKLIQKIEDKK